MMTWASELGTLEEFTSSMLRYAITDRKLFADRKSLIKQTARWAASGIEYIQVREKDLNQYELANLASEIVHAVRSVGGKSRVLLNGPAEIAVSTGCDGVHLPSGLPGDRIESAQSAFGGTAIISVSCHTLDEVKIARDHGASLVLFAPVFEKRTGTDLVPGQGLPALTAACRTAVSIPVIALGGVNSDNSSDCITAGAAGIAAIRFFAED